MQNDYNKLQEIIYNKNCQMKSILILDLLTNLYNSSNRKIKNQKLFCKRLRG